MTQRPYRGRRIDNGEWVRGNAIDGRYIVGGVLKRLDGSFDTPFIVEVDPSTVGQYTGLQDKYKNDVYKGDYLCDRESYDEIYYYEVIWSDTNACFYFRDIFSGECFGGEDIEWSQTEIVGNRWDNPELLEATKP